MERGGVMERKGIDELKRLAEAEGGGNADAQCEYALRLLSEGGVAINKEEAVRYLRLAAEQGHAAAQNRYV